MLRKTGIAQCVLAFSVALVGLAACREHSDDSAARKSAEENTDRLTIHYLRRNDSYRGWGLHLWGDAVARNQVTLWTAPRQYSRLENGTAVFEVPIKDPTKPLNFVLHMGDAKSHMVDLSIVPADFGFEVWVTEDHVAGVDAETGLGIPFDNEIDARAVFPPREP